MSISARPKADEDDVAASFSFLAVVDDENSSSLKKAVKKKAIIPQTSQEGQVKVFVWGLNDKDQLAGLKGSKVI